MATQQPFCPHYGSGITVSVGSSTGASTIPTGTSTVCITSKNSVLCYVRIGAPGVTATTADYPVPPNQQVTITRDPEHNTIAYIAPATGGDLQIMVGSGF